MTDAEQTLIIFIKKINDEPNDEHRRGMRKALNDILENKLNPEWIGYAIDWETPYIDELLRIPLPETVHTFTHDPE